MSVSDTIEAVPQERLTTMRMFARHFTTPAGRAMLRQPELGSSIDVLLAEGDTPVHVVNKQLRARAKGDGGPVLIATRDGEEKLFVLAAPVSPDEARDELTFGDIGEAITMRTLHDALKAIHDVKAIRDVRSLPFAQPPRWATKAAAHFSVFSPA